ncbi:condensation domain-containing protein [Nitratireductor kimnyeongensis]|uniref:Condensation domain-containing protein n=1 Tax=Nitratireductor kimnyeongensis TaxID=430679 RepID=A0ABW0T692_9HYPH|nr:condensation domain-containing protein [Nitratireductor kimnyeongensis]QZZ34846.1 condensation protein [Nitratireductor kimnyeongensis]
MSDIDNLIQTAAAGDIIGEFPCTQTQMRCWFLDRLNPGNPALNVAVRWEIRGDFRTESIEAAFRQIIKRHEILRTRFVETDGQPMQQVVHGVEFRMPVIDLRHVAEDQREARIQSISKETAAAPFDLGQPGLFRVTLLMVENRRGFILITAHQSCFDGWSIRVLGREVGELAAAIDSKRAPRLPELALQYGDFALWQEEYRNSYGFETEKTYWREQLRDAPYFEIRPDRPRGRVKTSRGDILSAVLPLEFGERIEAAARAHHVSLFSYGAAVISAGLHHYTGKREVLFGTQIAGREDVDLESLIGVFINNLVLRFDIAEELSFVDHLSRVSATVGAALNHQKMPFNNLVELINPVRDPSRNPLVSVNFNQQRAFLEDTRYGDFELISAPSQSPGVIYDLNFIMIGRPTGWRMSVEYNTDLFDEATVRELLDLWQKAYAFALDNPQAKIGTMAGPVRAGALPKEAQPEPASRLEALLLAHPNVADVAVRRDGPSVRPHAFVVPTAGLLVPLEALPAQLNAYLADRLPEEELPAAISVLLSLPKQADGTLELPAILSPVPPPKANVPAPVPAKDPSAPADKQTELGQIWAHVLDVSRVGPGDDFFALGGHSLLALRMFSGVREAFGIQPDLALLFREPTLSGFATAIFGTQPLPMENPEDDSSDTVEWETAIYRQGSGHCAVYTLNHPFLYYRMAKSLPGHASVVNLHMFNARIDKETEGFSLEKIAGDAVDAMQLGDTPKTVALVGLCVNGILAAEMTRQLRAQGHEVRFVALIDSWAPGYVRSQPALTRWQWNTEKRAKRLAYFTGKLLRGRMSLLTYLKEFSFSLRLIERFAPARAMNAEEETTEAVTQYLVRAARRYTPRALSGETVLFFRSQATHNRARRLQFGWRGFVSEDSPVFDLSGWHEDSLSDMGIDKLSAVLGERLELGGSAEHLSRT